MEVYMMRHGTPVELGVNGIERDEDKFLSNFGVAEVSKAAKGLKSLGCFPQRLLSSPLARARQTSQIVADEIAPGIEIEEQNFLIWNTHPSVAMNWLVNQDSRSIMLFGHMPNLALISSLMLSDTGDVDITIDKASALCIEFDRSISRGMGRLKWLIPARVWG